MENRKSFLLTEEREDVRSYVNETLPIFLKEYKSHDQTLPSVSEPSLSITEDFEFHDMSWTTEFLS